MNRYLPTGNEYLCIPTIREEDGAIDSLNVVLMKLDGLLEVAGAGGEPLIVAPGMQAEPGRWRWWNIEDWVPAFEYTGQPARRGVVCAPPGERFAFVRAPATGAKPDFKLCLGDVFQTANIRHRLPRVDFAARLFGWAGETGLMVDLYAGSLLASVCFYSPGGARFFHEERGRREEFTWTNAVNTAGPLRVSVECRGEPLLAVGVNLSSVGAMSAALEAGRVGPDEWLARSEAWLRARRASVAEDAVLEAKANRNGHFARFFAMARTLDTGEAVSMTSRSHRYYVSSAYWDRDSLLWLFPFLVRNDKALALDLLRYAFGRQLQDAGIHSRYISGRVLEFGFELDELLAPLVALGTWAKLHPGEAVWDEPGIGRGAVALFGRMKAWRREASGLYATELMPTDDRIEGGRDLLTYDNALVVRALESCLPVLRQVAPSLASFAASEAEAVRAAVRRHLVRDGMFMWAMDASGRTEFYDEAAGSLVLLPYHGFCGAADPAYKKTIGRLYSREYPYFRPGPFAELGNRHTGTPHPWVLSACNSALSVARASEGLDFLRRAPMDNGIACESVNIETGEPETGFHFATCAGFVAHAITAAAHPAA